MRIVLVLLLVVFCFSQTTIRRGNFFFRVVLSNQTGVATIRGQNRGRDGYSFIAISKRNDTFEDALVFMNFLTTERQIINRYVGQKDSRFPLTHTLWNRTTQNDGIYLRYLDRNYYPRGLYITDILYNIEVNQTLFINKFGRKFWVILGINYNYPKSPVNFELDADEAAVFEYDLNQNVPMWGIPAPTIRLENTHPSIFAISLAFIALTFALLIIFSTRQPLYSRGATPFIACIFQFIALFVDFPLFFLKLSDMRYYCLITDLIQKPLVLCLVFLSLLHFFRYIILLNLGKKKNAIVSQKNDKPGNVRGIFRVLKVLGKWYINLIVIICVALSYSVFNLILFLINGLDCTISDIPFGFYTSFLIIILLFFIVAMIFDLASNIDICKSCQLKLFWKEDIFLYRFEIYFFGIFLGFTAMVLTTIVQPLLIEFAMKDAIMASSTLITITYIILFFGQVLYPLILTIIQWIRELIKPPPDDDMLEAILLDPLGHDMFLNFAKSEYSIENVTCWDDIQSYKDEKDQVKKKQMARNIFDKYLNGDESELEVNVSRKSCTIVKEKMETGEIAKHLFDDIESALMINLSDTLTRLILTPEYGSYQLQKSFIWKTFGKHKKPPI